MNDTAKLIIGIVVGAFILLALFVLFAGGMGGGMGSGFGLLFMGFFLGLAIALVVSLVIWFSSQGRR